MKIKKILFASISLVFLGLAAHALAAENFVPLAGIPGLTQNVQANSAGLAGFFNNLYKYLIGLAAALAVIEIIWGGLEYSTQDSVSKKSDGKERIYQAILGLVLVLSPALVFSIINPSILNLSVNLPALNTTTSTPVGTGNGANGTGNGGTYSGTGNQTPVTAPPVGCRTISSGQYLESQACSSRNDVGKDFCKNGASPIINACRPDLLTGVCPDTSVLVYCGKSITVTYQNSKVVPRDLSAQNNFNSGCSADGGTMNASRTSLFSTGSCSGSGLDSSIVAGCYSETLTCQSK